MDIILLLINNLIIVYIILENDVAGLKKVCKKMQSGIDNLQNTLNYFFKNLLNQPKSIYLKL